ncbi:hypothetical protein COW36_17770 [bacterium (Candidatus Blackallbacteria) CG17_big_fil_post_rev_8_21_14_2_50_48_46]|uniref:TROVE domain-containing protein n=1 Tax=bacterium (Candidatus Blackallbacteria) CG17_big_fil_post_rev_8_21_14_2_50_48_46 TaxID=2014261 RepID=A0A2M7G0M2_9BACT|nr:MAG: hypothetical protein COW64_00955 [bacterium (Candidatus Blackallbacteria) CG18_big_fil_WC_8_21_14_2_50_49_26]PIW15265.1 MAG: hypothetical protein COW36_17770 [bacterium (Candidatus Blackallbacteria) CG17_big_fil_post_rev_8_21_14_2_50_48_46]PIW45226.1 MAG: hypothetical protein COW20_21245 [bacterium (Candidatus Blackallbacteria) CG13_big_fil_rev_8_21_14_2_50_49_14]
MAQYTAQVEAADILLFLSACLSGTSQNVYYSSASAQKAALDFLHVYICANYRDLYASALAQEINHHNQQRIIHMLLAHPTPNRAQQAFEQAQIQRALRKMPVHRVYKLFAGLAEARVNNRRSRATLKAWLAWRNNWVFDCVKYRRLLRIISRHWHLPLPAEEHIFLQDRHWQLKKFETPLLENFRQAHYSAQALSLLPLTVAEGLAPRFNLSRAQLLERLAPQMTAQEKLRLQTQAHQEKLKLELNPEKLSLTRLLAYILSLPLHERKARLSELESLVDRCRQRFIPSWLRLPKLALVLDNSQSSRGSRESWLRPLIAGLSAHYLLAGLSENYRLFWIHPPEHPLLVEAKGQTSLASPLLEALAWQPQEVVLISDGAENDPAGGVHWLLTQLSQAPWAGKRPFMLHFNPTLNPEDFGPSALSPELPMLGLHSGEQIALLWIMGRFATGQISLADFKIYLRRAAHATVESDTTGATL